MLGCLSYIVMNKNEIIKMYLLVNILILIKLEAYLMTPAVYV